MPGAYSEAAFFADLVTRGLLDADAAREIIAIDADEEAALLGLAESSFDRKLVSGAIKFRAEILRHFDRLLAPSEPTLAGPERAVVDYIMACR